MSVADTQAALAYEDSDIPMKLLQRVQPLPLGEYGRAAVMVPDNGLHG